MSPADSALCFRQTTLPGNNFTNERIEIFEVVSLRMNGHSKKYKKIKFLTVFLVCFFASVILITTSLANLRDIVTELTLATATDVITITVNDVVKEKIKNGTLNYGELVTLEKDNNGNITALVTNMANINTLQSEVSNAIVNKFSETDLTDVSIPLGNIIGGTIFSGLGPRIHMKVLSVTNVDTQFRNEFSTAGINQTRHQIMMDIKVDLIVLFAGKRETDSVTVSVNIAETVIIGNVPNMYANMG